MKKFAVVSICAAVGNEVNMRIVEAESEEALRAAHAKRYPENFWRILSVAELPANAKRQFCG